ncbi:MAG: DUF996 domain-containing protein [Candidatus Bathyarchaeota archaeon]|nr:DUF996 domain-containing protein [Candidatus Bathyarchaeota archaeon]
MQIETSKTLGGVGAILMFLGVIPFLSYYGIIELIGLILVMVALYNLAGYYAEKGIFNNALYGLITGIVGGVIAGGALILLVLSSLTDFLYTVYPDWNGDWSALSGLTPDVSNIDISAVMPFITGFFLTLLIFWIFAIIAFYFVRRSLTTLSAKSSVNLFSTAGLLMLIGAVLLVAMLIGAILIWIGLLLLAIAFFQIKPQQAQPAPPSPP